MNIFIDIETIPSACTPDVSEVKHPANIKKKENVDRWYAEHGEEERWEIYKKQALNSMRGEIFCIGLAIEDGKSFTVDTVYEFWEAIAHVKHPIFIGHNSRNFDMKWIYRHTIREGLVGWAGKIQFNKFRGNIEDTMELWSCDDYQDKFCKLDDVARFLGVGRKTEGIDGSKVFDYVMDGRGDVVKSYCCDDVDLTREVYRKLRG